MKPLTITISDTEVVINHLEVSEDGKSIDIEYNHDDSVPEDILNKKIGEFVIDALERYVK